MARRIPHLIAAITLVVLATAPAASADGLPTPGVVTPQGGLHGPNGERYVTTSRHGTTTVRKFAATAEVRSRTLGGNFTIPAIALDGSPAGISADDTTLVLIKPRASFPQASTHLLVLDAATLKVMDRITLRGDFSFDAISPDASTLYLIQYLSAQDPTRYAVRAYDVSAGRLVRQPIVDPDEHAGEMRGFPMTRVDSADGRWAYTLYDGGGGEPFVHALDTAEGRAVCVDLDGLVGPAEAHRAELATSPDGGQLTVAERGGHPLAVIDTNTLEASAPPAPGSTDGRGDGTPWVLIAIAAALGLGAAAAVIARGRRRASGLAAPGA
jgi:DNA-binding beta-propeller fold protein YncE